MYIVNHQKQIFMRRTKEEAEQTRKDILNAAVNVFYEKGVTRSTLEDIAKAADVTRGAIYWHFKNKLEIFDALHERLHRPFLEMILEDLEKDHPEPLIQLQDLCIRLFHDLEQDESKRRALDLFMLKCDYSGELAGYKEEYLKKKAEKQKAFARYFEKARAKGKLPADADPVLWAQMVGCFTKGLLVEYLETPESADIKKKIPQLTALFFKSIQSA